MLPHQHHGELNDSDHTEAHIEADELIDYLKLIFHTDLGDGHMETFDQGKGSDFDSSLAVIPAVSLLSYGQPFVNNSSNSIHFRSTYADDFPILKQYFLSNTSFRGPPTVV